MSVLLPKLPIQADVNPRLIDFGQVLTPPLGGPSQFVGRLGARYALDVKLPPLKDAARKWIARRLKSKAEATTLVLEWPQLAIEPPGGTPVVDGSGAGGTTLPVRGLAAAATVLEGAFFSFIAGGRHYLHAVTEDAVADGSGDAILSIAPMLRVSPADGAALDFVTPKLEGYLDGNTVDWSLTLMRWVGGSFTLSENE